MRILQIGNINNSHEQKWAIPLAEGQEVHMLSPENTPDPGKVIVHLYDPDKLYAADNYLLRFIKKILDLRRYIKQIKPDIVHFQFVVDLAFTAPFLGFKNIVLTPWGSDILIFPERSKKVKFLLKLTLKKARAITILSEQILNKIKILTNISGKLIEKVYFSLDKNFRRYIDQQKIQALKKQYGFESEHKIIFSFRNVMEVYNLEELIKAVAMVIRKDPQARFLMNYEYHHLTDRVEKIKALIQAEGIAEKTVITEKLADCREIFNLYALADVGISFSKSDGCPVSVLECMAVGLPLIVSDIQANRQILRENSVQFVKIGDVAGLAERIEYLLNNRQLAKKQAEQAYNDFLKVGYNEDNVQKLVELYKNMLKE